MSTLKAGARLRSAVSSAEFIVTKAPAGDVELCCGGAALVDMNTASEEQPGLDGAVMVGKRYVDAAEQLEVLCTKAGAGELSLNGETLVIRNSKALPSSD